MPNRVQSNRNKYTSEGSFLFSFDFLKKLLIFKTDLFLFVCVCGHTTRVCRCPKRPKEDMGYLELELQRVVSHPTWVLGSKLGSSGGTLCTLN